MKNMSLEMGRFYSSKNGDLVRAICRAYEHGTNDSKIVYTLVGKDGCASDAFLMSENEFTEFVHL